jgi:hypothetical protein
MAGIDTKEIERALQLFMNSMFREISLSATVRD